MGVVKHTAALVERETARVVEHSGMSEVEGVLLAHWCLFIERGRRKSE